MNLFREPLPDATVVQGERVEKELDSVIARAVSEEDAIRPGRAAANEVARKERTRQEYREAQERERTSWAWVDHHERQRRAHLELALEHRAKSRELREVS